MQWKLALATTKSFFLGYTDPKAVGSLTTPTLLRTCWGGTEWRFSVGFPQETDFYYYRWSEPGQAKTRKQWRENTCRPKKKCMECNVKLPSRRGLSQYQRHCWTLFKSTNSTFSRQEEDRSDHHLIYDILKQSALQHRRKTITFRNLKNVDTDHLNEDLANAPWTIGETFEAINMTHLKVYWTNICHKWRWVLDRKMYHIW